MKTTENPLTEAIEICESMMAYRDRNGLGRLHMLLCVVQEQYFTSEDDTAVTAEFPPDYMPAVDDLPF